VNCLIENPAFDSQTKTCLTTPSSKFGSTARISEAFIKKICNSSIAEKIVSWNQDNSFKLLKKLDGTKQRTVAVAKLVDAHLAGTAKSAETTLIITEGNSALLLAKAGHSVIGKEIYGLYPIRGKLLNVREAKVDDIKQSPIISELVKVLGLKFLVDYSTPKQFNTLRYGKILIMTDQDADGYHIKGLIFNLFAVLWPALFKKPGFLNVFRTPLIKCTKKKQTMVFYNLPQYEAWALENPGWPAKYYKGLATSTREEAIEYFSDLPHHSYPFIVNSSDDVTKIELGFHPKMQEQRKEWLRAYDPTTYLDYEKDTLSFANFVDSELRLYSWVTLVRAIPQLMDGLKPAQRKLIYTMLKRNMVDDIKIPQLCGQIMDEVGYHHAPTSLYSTIFLHAFNYPGTNNLNLLDPVGQFGNRDRGSKDIGAPRYLFTKLATLTQVIFPQVDTALYEYHIEEGSRVEPKFLLPILPMILVNGCSGIGTGWATNIPPHNPTSLVTALKCLLEGEEVPVLVPWYRDIKGPVVKKKGVYYSQGIWEETKDGIHITELPPGRWTSDAKKDLEELNLSVVDNSQDLTVDLQVTITEEQKAVLFAKQPLEQRLKLQARVLSNLVLFEEDELMKYKSTQEILLKFFKLRLALYGKRKEWLIETKTAASLKLRNKVRFIQAILDGYDIRKKKKDVLFKELADLKYTPFAQKANGKKDFSYLGSLPLLRLTKEAADALIAELKALDEEIEVLKKTSIKEMWIKDLDLFLITWEETELARIAALKAKPTSKKRKAPLKGRKPKTTSKKRKV